MKLGLSGIHNYASIGSSDLEHDIKDVKVAGDLYLQLISNEDWSIAMISGKQGSLTSIQFSSLLVRSMRSSSYLLLVQDDSGKSIVLSCSCSHPNGEDWAVNVYNGCTVACDSGHDCFISFQKRTEAKVQRDHKHSFELHGHNHSPQRHSKGSKSHSVIERAEAAVEDIFSGLGNPKNAARKLGHHGWQECKVLSFAIEFDSLLQADNEFSGGASFSDFIVIIRNDGNIRVYQVSCQVENQILKVTHSQCVRTSSLLPAMTTCRARSIRSLGLLVDSSTSKTRERVSDKILSIKLAASHLTEDDFKDSHHQNDGSILKICGVVESEDKSCRWMTSWSIRREMNSPIKVCEYSAHHHQVSPRDWQGLARDANVEQVQQVSAHPTQPFVCTCSTTGEVIFWMSDLTNSVGFGMQSFGVAAGRFMAVEWTPPIDSARGVWQSGLAWAIARDGRSLQAFNMQPYIWECSGNVLEACAEVELGVGGCDSCLLRTVRAGDKADSHYLVLLVRNHLLAWNVTVSADDNGIPVVDLVLKIGDLKLDLAPCFLTHYDPLDTS
eukprot:746638-Hanusia_phi.AAC.3